MDANIIKTIFKKAQMELQNSGLDNSFSGCTCIAVIFYDHNIYCVSVGDSRAILCQGYITTQISTNHKPDADIERLRI